jgi:hypothetical protein
MGSVAWGKIDPNVRGPPPYFDRVPMVNILGDYAPKSNALIQMCRSDLRCVTQRNDLLARLER